MKAPVIKSYVNMPDPNSPGDRILGMRILYEETSTLHEPIDWLEIELMKAKGTLANNLCPDHRDKQTGKPCLACQIEYDANRLKRTIARAETMAATGASATHIIELFRTLGSEEAIKQIPLPSPLIAARQFIRGELSVGKFGELLGLNSGELHDFKNACSRVFEEQAIEYNPDTIIAAIIKDIRSRSGIRHEWDEIDVDVRNEIVAAWRKLFPTAIPRPGRWILVSERLPERSDWFGVLDAQNEKRCGLFTGKVWFANAVEPIKAWCEFPDTLLPEPQEQKADGDH